MASRLFRAHGDICASHPWEVIVATLTLTACMLTVDKQQQQQQQQQQQTHLHYGVLASPHKQHCNGCFWLEADFIAADAIVMTLIRCMAVLYCYYQFCNLHKLGSKYILGIAGLFTVFSSFVFTSTVINFLRSDISDLKDALFFFLLLIDLSKAALLAQFALSSSNQNEVKQNIARGMALLGPTITLDTVVETLVIGVGTLSGVRRLEVLCWFACLSVLVNYIVFMTFYPACLSLILELSRSGDYKKLYSDASLSLFSIREEDQKPNPVVQRVKLIMSLGLMIVHAHSRWPLRDDEEDHISPLMNGEHTMTLNRTEDTPLHGYIIKWVTVSADHIVIFILLLALAIKFIFFETKEDIASQIRMAEEQEASKSKKNQLPKPVFTSGDDLIDVGGTNRPYVIVPTEDKEVQTEYLKTDDEEKVDEESCQEEIIRSLSECISIYETELSASSLTDKEVIQLIQNKRIPGYQIEKAVKDLERGVGIRRQVLELSAKLSEHTIDDLPFRNYDYSKVMGACCENVIGYVPVPVGVAGPLHLDGQMYHIPLATTEGCLVASINRGSRALINGINSRIVADGMTRGPVVRFPCLARASQAMAWMEASDNFKIIKESFDSTSRFARLSKLHTRIAGRILFVRFVATTGDAMGMNMLSKGTETALKFIRTQFPDMEIISLSGNFCTDKKPAAVNWIEGRGKSVVCEAVVPANIITTVLKSNVHALIDVNRTKNMIGSAIAGSIGGFNAHAANVVTAMFIATGQDPAQNVGSSNCITLMEPWGKDGEDLYITCTMPSVEVGTIGGGTSLPPQAACLEMLGIKGPNMNCPGENSKQLARIVCGAVLAGELSLISALAAGHLVGSHLKHNRSSATVTSAIAESSKTLNSSTLSAISSSCYKS